MNTKDDGGPAFPVGEEFDERSGDVTRYSSPGMSLRDYFAAKAMQALIAEGAGHNSDPRQIGPMCSTAYDWADSMMKARAA
jgi:hypothetical protein